jgi:hypothetical protein
MRRGCAQEYEKEARHLSLLVAASIGIGLDADSGILRCAIHFPGISPHRFYRLRMHKNMTFPFIHPLVPNPKSPAPVFVADS